MQLVTYLQYTFELSTGRVTCTEIEWKEISFISLKDIVSVLGLHQAIWDNQIKNSKLGVVKMSKLKKKISGYLFLMWIFVVVVGKPLVQTIWNKTKKYHQKLC